MAIWGLICANNVSKIHVKVNNLNAKQVKANAKKVNFEAEIACYACKRLDAQVFTSAGGGLLSSKIEIRLY